MNAIMSCFEKGQQWSALTSARDSFDLVRQLVIFFCMVNHIYNIVTTGSIFYLLYEVLMDFCCLFNTIHYYCMIYTHYWSNVTVCTAKLLLTMEHWYSKFETILNNLRASPKVKRWYPCKKWDWRSWHRTGLVAALVKKDAKRTAFSARTGYNTAMSACDWPRSLQLLDDPCVDKWRKLQDLLHMYGWFGVLDLLKLNKHAFVYITLLMM